MDRLSLPPEVSKLVFKTVTMLNPEYAERGPAIGGGIGVIVIIAHGECPAPEMCSNLPPEVLHSLLGWIVEHASEANMEVNVVGDPN